MYSGMYANADLTEAACDCILIPKVVLPDNQVLENIYFGWDNFVMDEIEKLVDRHLRGRTEDYQMVVTSSKGTVVLQPRAVVEFYREDIEDHTRVSVEPIVK